MRGYQGPSAFWWGTVHTRVDIKHLAWHRLQPMKWSFPGTALRLQEMLYVILKVCFSGFPACCLF